MTKNTRFSPEVRQRAIRMVLESQGEYDSQWAAIENSLDDFRFPNNECLLTHNQVIS